VDSNGVKSKLKAVTKGGCKNNGISDSKLDGNIDELLFSIK
jgi:hypothetical protein